MATSYYALVELDDETPENPGGLVRLRLTTGLYIDVYLGDGHWDTRTASLVGTVFPNGAATESSRLTRLRPSDSSKTGRRRTCATASSAPHE